MQYQDRYERFQKDAVNAIVSDFREEPAGRYLLVVPTGGGKTYTAVKALSELYDRGFLRETDRVLWVVHRDELRIQAEETFAEFAASADRPNLPGRVDIVMLAGVREYLEAHPELRIAVVDEAHHVAAASYQPLLAVPTLGILGLTATPSRHDGKPLRFNRESYSIGFPDLVELGVLLRPEVIKVDGGKYDIDDIGLDSDELEAFNNPERNARIVGALNDNSEKLHKVIIYVGTKEHARDLYGLLRVAPVAKRYDAIGLILGGERRRYVAADGFEYVNEERSEFVKAMKAYGRALVVNVDVLTEGYDDRTVNAVVMARPTNSKLVYMQAMGRAVRLDPKNLTKQAYVVEVVDELPNIKYRIDNRWLFSDVSDALEPEVEDVEYTSIQELPTKIQAVFDRYQVPADARALPEISERDRVTMLLFKVYAGEGRSFHLPVVVTNDTRQAASNFFNYLSARMGHVAGFAHEQMVAPVWSSIEGFPTLSTARARKLMLGAMENAWALVQRGGGDIEKNLRPWITFVSFKFRADERALSADLLQFTEDMLNQRSVRETLAEKGFSDGYVLAKLPLPLSGTWGMFLPPAEFQSIRETVDALAAHKNHVDAVVQWKAAVDVLGAAKLPIESRFSQGLATIVRENVDYFRSLQRQPRRDGNDEEAGSQGED